MNAREMVSVGIRRHGGPEALEVLTGPVPKPGPGEVLVRNHWIGVNYVDLQHRAGRPYPVTLPLVPGTEAAGVVEAVGRDVDASLVGARVVHAGHLAGCYAEFTAVRREHLTPVPPDVGLDIAAALTLAGTTAHVLTRTAVTAAGRTVVVHAAAGSTGGAVVQLAHADGARVIGVVSTQDKARVARELGADDVVVADGTPLAQAVRALTEGRGVDLVYDATGRDTFEASLQMLATGATLVVYGATSGPPAPVDIGRLSGLTADSVGTGSLGIRWVASGHYLEGARREAVTSAVLRDIASGRLTPRIAARLPLEAAVDAHRLLAGRSVLGKVLLHTSTKGISPS